MVSVLLSASVESCFVSRMRDFSRWIGLISVKRREGRGFPRADRADPRDFPWAEPKGNPKEQPCQPEKNPVLPDLFPQIYILFLISFSIAPLTRLDGVGPVDNEPSNNKLHHFVKK